MEDDAVVDGIVVVEVAKVLLRPDLAYSVSTVASMDTMLHSVLKEPVHQEAVVLLSLEISEAISLKHAEDKDEEEIVEAVATEGLVFRASTLSMMQKAMNIRSMKMETSFWNSLRKKMLPSRSKTNKIRETEKNRYRSCQWVCGGTLSIKYWFSRVIK